MNWVIIHKKGFTFIEVMVTLAVLGIVIAIAFPNFMRYRRRSAMSSCIVNLKQIDSAKTQASFSYTDNTSPGILFGSAGFIRITPVCPMTKGSYSIGEPTDHPECPNAVIDTEFPHILPAPLL